ncbi:unnamed protein product, partial [marine sediment metagenome]
VFTDRKVPLVAIADNLCSIGAYEWDDELSVVWREFHAFEKHSSTALLRNGMMVFGRQDGKTLAYDMETGVKLWEHDAGLKGERVGGAMISPKHAGFILNTDNAKAADVFSLIRRIEDRVWDRFGVKLEREVKLIGEFDDI